MDQRYKQLCKYPEAKVLIVDDAPDSCKILSALLKSAGYKNITITHDPHQGLSLWHELSPDVFLLDYVMPEMNGIELMQAIMAQAPGTYVPIIMLTASDEEAVKLEALSLCAQDFAAKPFNYLDMLARINAVIQSSLLHQQLKIENSQLTQTAQTALSKLETEHQSRIKAEQDLQHSLLHDSLTELPNKTLFYDRITQYINQCAQEKNNFSVFLISIENLRTINNTLGHFIGDMLLMEVAQRLGKNLNCVDSNSHSSVIDCAARLAGNTFVLTASNSGPDNNINEQMNQLLTDLKHPYQLEGLTVDLLMHMGIVHYPLHGDNAKDLLQHADVAAFNAKKNKTDFEFYSSELDEFTTNRLTLMQDLKIAIAKNELELFLQPKINLDSHAIYGFEALLRWQHPEQGFIPPDRIVETAESTSLIEMLTRWVITTACSMLKTLQDKGYQYSISVNITATDLLNPEILSHVLEQVKTHQIKPECLTLEITEGSMIINPQQAYDVIKIYRDADFAMSIDDFGTGYSSLAYLQKLPVNELKIDRSFVMDMHENKDNQMIVKSIIDIAHHLNLHVVAEGIESETVYDMLAEFGCDSAQGYFLSRPINFNNTLELLKTFSIKSLRA